MDLPAEFYIETVRDVFQEHLLPQGKMTYHGPAGESRLDQADWPDDGRRREGRHLLDRPDARRRRISVPACAAYRKVHHMQAGVGHYGVFSASAGTTKSIRCCGISCTSIRDVRHSPMCNRTSEGARKTGMMEKQINLASLERPTIYRALHETDAGAK